MPPGRNSRCPIAGNWPGLSPGGRIDGGDRMALPHFTPCLCVAALAAMLMAGAPPAAVAQPRRHHHPGLSPRQLNCKDAELAPSAANTAAVGSRLLCPINRERVRRHLVPLRRNQELGAGARGHTADMLSRHYFAHESPDGHDLVDRLLSSGYIGRGHWVVGENLGWATDNLASPRAMVAAWMNSPSHRSNILETSYREAGVEAGIGIPNPSLHAGKTYSMDFGVRN